MQDNEQELEMESYIMKRMLHWIGKVTIAGVLTVFLLSAFCMIYNYDGIHSVSESGATDYVWEEGQLKATMKEGFAWIRMDAYGYNNVFDYSEEPDILLMGSSHMEAAQIAEDENVGYLLNETLPHYRTYNIGMSGHTIYRCMDNLENAIKTYNPQRYVVMVIDDVELSIDEMKSVLEEKAAPIPSYDSGLIYYLQKIPALKVIYKQVIDWISLGGDANKRATTTESNTKLEAEDEYQSVLTEFLSNAFSLCEASGVKLMIVYQPSQKIKSNGEVVFEYSDEHLQIFAKECKVQGITFCDMTESFAEMYSEDHILAHGFLNSSVGAGHLNKYGHNAIANVIVSKIQELEAQ